MRILFLDGGENRGTYYRALSLGKHLVGQGHEVLLIAPREATAKVSKKTIDGVNIILTPKFTTSKIFLASVVALGGVVIQTLLNCVLLGISDFDVLHSFDVAGPQNATPTVLSQILRIFHLHDKKIFVDWDDWWGRGGLFYTSSGYGWMQPLDTIVRFLEEKVPLFVDAVTVSSDVLRQRALSVGVKPENLFLIPNGANIDYIKPLSIYEARKEVGLPTKKIIYSHFGSFYDLETLKSLILVHERVAKHAPEAILLLVGLPKKQADFVRSCTTAKNVICLDRQPYHRYSVYLGASDILLLPLKDSIENRARWPLRLSDYLSAGRPVVASALPVIKDALQKCGLLTRPGEYMDFADKILEIIKDPNLRNEMGERARELAERQYSWQLLAKQLENIYSRCL